LDAVNQEKIKKALDKLEASEAKLKVLHKSGI
jgi:hypothetical protein